MTEQARRVVIVDIETSGLNPELHSVLEIAAVPLDSSVTGGVFFTPALDVDWLTGADPEALSVNRYFERRLWETEYSEADTRASLLDLGNLLDGAIVAGSNPLFDVGFLRDLYDAYDLSFPLIHHRLFDLAPYAAGALGLGADLPSLARVCELLEVTNPDPHTALGDARATAYCINTLMEGAR